MAEKKTRDIPPSKLKWLRRPAERAKLPASHFFLPKERKFPYKNKDGTINCRLVRAAIVRAAQHGYPNVERRARKVYERHCAEKSAIFPLLSGDDYRILDWWEDQLLMKAVEETPSEIRIRVKPPGKYDPKSFRYITISADKGIKAVVGCPKGKFKGGRCQVGTEIQSYRFDIDKWTKSEAKKWVKEHKKAITQSDLTKQEALIRINYAPVPVSSAKQVLDNIIALEAMYLASSILSGGVGLEPSEERQVLSIFDSGRTPEARREMFAELIKTKVSARAIHSDIVARGMRGIILDTKYILEKIEANAAAKALFDRITQLTAIPQVLQVKGNRKKTIFPIPDTVLLGIRISRKIEDYLAKSYRPCCQESRRAGLEVTKFIDGLLRTYIAPYSDTALRLIKAYNFGVGVALAIDHQLTKGQIEMLIKRLTADNYLLVNVDKIEV